ncbi:MAG: DUF6035 family protein [Hydrogenophaga sp.]|nr:DUF6035 family protein [Hydrogenophaga sp.]
MDFGPAAMNEFEGDARPNRAIAPGKRQRELPPAGEPLCVDKPEIAEVLDTVSGVYLRAQDVIGSDYAALVQLRTQAKAAHFKDQPLYRCSTCLTPVFICARKDGQKFFFKHSHEDGSCPAITRSALSQDEIDARKYNGVKESQAHLQMKDWLEACLKADPRFSLVSKEARWAGRLTGEWRKPDVSAVYEGVRVAFEIQLTTTYLDVIVKRREFYLQEGGLIFWVFASFDNEHRRLTEDDVFYNNNQNAFIVNTGTVKESLEQKRLMLECVWQVPTADGSHSALRRQRVAFDQLTLDQATQRAYFFDHEGAKLQLSAARNNEVQALRDEIDAWWDRKRDEDAPPQDTWVKFAPRLRKLGVQTPYSFRDVDQVLLTALYSAKHGQPWGQRKNLLVEVAHHLAMKDRDRFVWFMYAVKRYGREYAMAHEGDEKKWAAKLERAKADYSDDRQQFEPRRTSQALAEFLFPELCPFPDLPAPRVSKAL